MRSTTLTLLSVLLIIIGTLPAHSQPALPTSEFFGDTFQKDVPAIFWNVANRENLLKIKQGKGEVRLTGSADTWVYGSYELALPFAPRDFWISVEVKLGKGNQGQASLGVHNGFAWENPSHCQMILHLEKGWFVRLYEAGLPPAERNQPPDKNNPRGLVGDESKNFHTMKIAYDHQNKILTAYVDDFPLGQETIAWDLSKGFAFRFWAWNENKSKSKTDVYFRNFQSNLPREMFK